MSNKIHKNFEKFSEVGVMSAVSTLVVYVINRAVVDLPTEVSIASVTVLTAVIAGFYNALTHGPLVWPRKKK